MFKKFRKGSRIHTKFDKKSEQITIVSHKKDKIKEKQVEVEVSEELESGKPADLFIVHHRQEEFCLDFGKVLKTQDGIKGKVLSRVITSPAQAKALALKLKKYL